MKFINTFFGDKDYFSSGAGYFWSIGHIIFIALAVISIVLIIYFGRNISAEKFRKVMIGVMITLFVIDILKTVWNLVVYKTYDWYEDLPLQICSIYKYVIILSVWGKGGVKRSADGYLFTFGVIGGLANFFLPGVLRYYPVYQFRTFISLLAHYLMVLVGLWAWFSKQYKPKFIDCLYAYIPLLILSVVAIPLNFIFDWDYVFYNGNYSLFAVIAGAMPKAIYVILLAAAYLAIIILLFYLPNYLYQRHKNKKLKNQMVVNENKAS